MDERIKIDLIDYDLSNLHQFIWKLLVKATHQKQDPYRTPVMGTYGDQGINQRTVVLRNVDEIHKTLYIHTDLRSGKIGEIKRSNQVHWLFWNPRKRMQFRMIGTAQIHTDDDTADQMWENESPASLKLYMSSKAPGTKVDLPASGLPTNIERERLTRNDIEAGRKNFCVISSQIHQIDWLLLAPEGHRRAKFYLEDGNWQKYWIIP